MTVAVRRLVGLVIWLAVVVVIAFGSAGIATGLNPPPSDTGQNAMTEAGDAEVTPVLDAATAGLTDLSADVASLGQAARGALAALNGTDTTAAQDAISAGDDLVTTIRAKAADIRRELATVPYVGTATAGIHLSDDLIARYTALVAALDATDGLDDSWLRLSIGSIAAAQMSSLLDKHDQLVNQAVERGRIAKYGDAIEKIDQAAAQLDAAKIVRDQLANTVDVSVLDDWIGRNVAYDDALRELYRVIPNIGKKVTPKIRAAVKAEAAARSRLPPDTRGLIIIMADIGRGGMNGAVIAIEQARASLDAALVKEAARSPDVGTDDAGD